MPFAQCYMKENIHFRINIYDNFVVFSSFVWVVLIVISKIFVSEEDELLNRIMRHNHLISQCKNCAFCSKYLCANWFSINHIPKQVIVRQNECTLYCTLNNWFGSIISYMTAHSFIKYHPILISKDSWKLSHIQWNYTRDRESGVKSFMKSNPLSKRS